ncbi:GntR family transcriptional regulator [Sporosarcina highlanderae]|uniref:GntR family transcriptional regulator n=1 Tax=Sporosarcina highlanderae TaxID=3035916 RepID=UPI00343CA11A
MILFIQIEPTSEIPIYTQLANQLIELIATGTLQTSEALPSVRSLAADLGVNMHTVNKAYHELEKKNIIQIIPKSGAVVNEISSTGPSDSQIEHIKQVMKPLIAESIVYGMDKKQILSIATSLISGIRRDEE